MKIKQKSIARLTELSAALGRHIDTGGSEADLALRLREAEEELAAIEEGDTVELNSPDVALDGTHSGAISAHSATESVQARACITLALTVKRNGRWRSEVVVAGQVVTLLADDFASLASGLAVRVD